LWGGVRGTAVTARALVRAVPTELIASARLVSTAPANDHPLPADLRLERGPSCGRNRDEQPARGLRVVAERLERRRQSICRHVRRREVAVARVSARAHVLAGEIERAVDGRKTLRLEPHRDAAAA